MTTALGRRQRRKQTKMGRKANFPVLVPEEFFLKNVIYKCLQENN